MRESSKDIVAIVCSDLHFCDNPPIARSVEDSWFDVMGRNIDQLRELKSKFKCPIVVAGDVFDRWKCSPNLINFLLERLPELHAIAGQHDLPNHDYDRIGESAYWTLVAAGKVNNLSPGRPIKRNGVWLYGFPWDYEIMPPNNEQGTHLAVVHSYIWIKGHAFPGAPAEQRLKHYLKKLQGYDAAVFGDNHQGFIYGSKKPYIMNCGTFIRRRTDERNYNPRVGLLQRNGQFVPYMLDILSDKFIDVGSIETAVNRAIDAADFIRELSGIGSCVVDFVQALEQFCSKNKIDKHIREVITRILEDRE